MKPSLCAAALIAFVAVLAPREVAALLTFAAVLGLVAWLGAASLTDANEATDDRAAFLPAPQRRAFRFTLLPVISKLRQVWELRPRRYQIPRPRRRPRWVPPGQAVEIPSTIRWWLRPPEKRS